MRKTNKKQILAVGAAWLMALGMIGCQTAAPDPTETTGELLVVTTDATEPEKEAFVSSSRYQATLPTEPEKPAATQPAEAETEPANTGNGETAGNGNTTAGPAPVAPVDPAPVEPAPTEPAPVETEPPATEAPAVSLDYAAAGNYGDSYAVSTYGCVIDYSLNSENAGYCFPSCRSIEYYLNNGGQAALNASMAAQVDVTAYDVGSGFAVNCSVYESGGYVYFVVYYG